jgi:hypothetical protein
MNIQYTDDQIRFVLEKRKAGATFQEIATAFNARFHQDRSMDCLKKVYYKFHALQDDAASLEKMLKDRERMRRANSLNSKENRVLVGALVNSEDIKDAIASAAAALKKLPPRPAKAKSDKNKSSMTLELLISDVHVGKLTDNFNHEVLKRRIKQIAEVTAAEVRRARQHYNVERIIVAFIGDLIESATMHGVESARGCEFGNSRQIQEAIAVFYRDLIMPLSELGLSVDCVGVTGNHDRTQEKRTYLYPGEENVSWIIYKTMEEFAKVQKLSNVSWSIPRGSYHIDDIYGENVLYEHYDNAHGSNLRQSLENLMSKRVRQVNQPIHFMRGGHFHEPAEFGIGKIVVNGSVPGNDSYSEIHGFNCEPSQTLNFYIKRDRSDKVKRITSFYKRFLIQLD